MLLPNYKKYIFPSLLLATVGIIFLNVYFIIIPILIFLIFSLYENEKFWIIFTIISFFVASRDISIELRFAAIATNMVLLSILFIRKYEFRIKDYPQFPIHINYFFILLFGGMFITSLMSEYTLVGFEYTAKTLFFFLIVYLYYSLLINEENYKLYLYAMLGSTLVLALSVVINFILTGFQFIDLMQNTYVRVTGLIESVNALASFYIFGISIIISFMSIYKENKKIRFILKVILIIILLGMIFSISRSSLLASIIAICIYFFVIKRKQFLKIFIPIIVLISIPFLFKESSDFIFLLFRMSEGVAQRDQLWQLAINIINDNLIFGVGPGAYQFYMFKYFPVAIESWQGQFYVELWNVAKGTNLSHNFYLALFSDMGIFGLMIAVSVPSIFIYNSFKLFKSYSNQKNEKYFLAVGFFALGIALALRGMVEVLNMMTYGWITLDLPFWLILIILLRFNYPEQFQKKEISSI